ncbi:hypothetical protein QG37_00764 [Candidozyma auris]|uniref:Uncharacterized protein n=1 Tax=Candidozyma auris TaxID=498019 RepID=A0A0L0P6U7_CANAR|nr:hypothetical protein QG37_00764 [[Candida] auris]
MWDSSTSEVLGLRPKERSDSEGLLEGWASIVSSVLSKESMGNEKWLGWRVAADAEAKYM